MKVVVPSGKRKDDASPYTKAHFGFSSYCLSEEYLNAISLSDRRKITTISLFFHFLDKYRIYLQKIPIYKV